MPKKQIIDPKKTRQSSEITFQPIPANQYQSNFKKELKTHGKERLIRIYEDMLIIREFETMLNLIKTQGAYEGVEYNHPGPAHLSIGQEAAAVGQAVHLSPEDFIFGSHRSHGEILAKCFSAIHQLDDQSLTTIMETFFDGATFNAIKDEAHATTREQAEAFVLYGTLAEIFARDTGFNRGLGGSMHAFFIPFS